jgi:hypothetical protein
MAADTHDAAQETNIVAFLLPARSEPLHGSNGGRFPGRRAGPGSADPTGIQLLATEANKAIDHDAFLDSDR